MNRVCDFRVREREVDFNIVDGKRSFDLNWEGNVIGVFEKKKGFKNFRVVELYNGELEAGGLKNRCAGAAREASVERVLGVRNKGVLLENLVSESAVEIGRPGWIEDEVPQAALQTIAKCGSAAAWDGEDDGLRVGVEHVENAVLFGLELDFFRCGGFAHGIGKLLVPAADRGR